jgi:hypothetical protein
MIHILKIIALSWSTACLSCGQREQIHDNSWPATTTAKSIQTKWLLQHLLIHYSICSYPSGNHGAKDSACAWQLQSAVEAAGFTIQRSEAGSLSGQLCQMLGNV